MIKFKPCSHRFVNGETCASPAKRGENYCFFHLRYRRENDPTKENYELPILEDRDGINLLVSDVVRGLLKSNLDTKKASLALYAAQVASMNLNRWEKVTETPEGDDEPETPKEPIMLKLIREGLAGITVASGPDAGKPFSEVFARGLSDQPGSNKNGA